MCICIVQRLSKMAENYIATLIKVEMVDLMIGRRLKYFKNNNEFFNEIIVSRGGT